MTENEIDLAVKYVRWVTRRCPKCLRDHKTRNMPEGRVPTFVVCGKCERKAAKKFGKSLDKYLS